MIPTVKNFRHEISLKTIKTIQSNIAEIHKIPSTAKTGLMMFIGSTNVSSKYISKLHVNMKPLSDLLMVILSFTGILNWKHCFNNLKQFSEKMLR